MAFEDYIAACNNHDPDKYRPFLVSGIPVGNVRHDIAEALSGHDAVLVEADGLRLDDNLTDFDSRSRVLDKLASTLAAEGLVPKLRGEMYPVKTGFEAEALAEIDRAAVPGFGLRAYGVHLNGYVRRADGGIDLWIARRASDRTICPGMLDNMVAGGQPIGLGLMENVIKECGEEANVPPKLAATAQPVGAITYMLETEWGLKPDTMFCYDLELPADFTPSNTDGEVETFYLWPASQVAEIVRDTFDFKFNCNLVIIDFLIRHGLIPPETPGYVSLIRGLRK